MLFLFLRMLDHVRAEAPRGGTQLLGGDRISPAAAVLSPPSSVSFDWIANSWNIVGAHSSYSWIKLMTVLSNFFAEMVVPPFAAKAPWQSAQANGLQLA
jgi:hypothetical protein